LPGLPPPVTQTRKVVGVSSRPASNLLLLKSMLWNCADGRGQGTRRVTTSAGWSPRRSRC